MQIENNILVEELLTITEQSIVFAKKFKTLSVHQLNKKQNPSAWSVLECIEHLNLYGDFYLPEIERRILSQETQRSSKVFKSGLIGSYFANLMQVKNGKLKKMQSPKNKNPNNSILTLTTIDRFVKQAEMLKSLLLQSKGLNLTKTKTSISLTKYIKLRLGDTFRFFIYHIERHMLQAEQALKAVA